MRVVAMAAFLAVLIAAPASAVTKLSTDPDITRALTQPPATSVAPPETVIDRVEALASGLPEPTGWVFMILGFCGAGAALRAQRRQAKKT